MRFVHALLLLIFLAAVFLFAVQNTDAVTVRFLDRGASLPLALLILGVYLLGMLSGWSVLGLLNRLTRRVTER